MDNDNIPTTKGFTRYVEKQDFDAFCIKVETNFHGSEGRNGLIGDVRDIKNQINLIKWAVGISVGIISPIMTALILKYIIKL